MMTIEEALSSIKNAIYGKDVRQAMHDGILQAEGGAGTVAKKAEASAKDSAESAKKAAEFSKKSEIASKAIEGKADQAVTIAKSANSKSDSTQLQLDEIVINGDSSVEAAQARVDIKNISYDTLKDRLDKEQQEVGVQLAQNNMYTKDTFNYLSDGGRKVGPAVTFIADDAPKNDLTKLLPIMKEKGVPFGIAVVSEWIGKTIHSSDFAGGSETFMDIDELRYMQDNGAQILSHTANHKSMIDPSVDVESEMRSSYEKLSELGFVVDGFVYPYNYFNNDTISIAKKYYKYSFARGTSNLVGELDNNKINRYSFGSYYDAPSMSKLGHSTSSLPYYKERVDYAIENNEWLVFVIHTHTTNFVAEQQQHLRDIIDYIRTLGVDIVSPREGFSRLGNIMQAGNLKIDSSGSLTGVYESYYGAAIDHGISGQSPLTDFEKGKVSVHRVGRGNVTTGWGYPENYVYGILKTFYLDAEEPYFSYQTFESEEGSSYIRYWQRFAKVWGKWINNGAKVSVLNPTERDISGLSPITDFEKGKISVHKFGTTNVTVELGFPVNFVFGILTTHHIDELVPQFAYQTFEVNGHATSSVVYKRHWDNASKKWTAWSAGA